MNRQNSRNHPNAETMAGCQRCGRKESYVFAGKRLCRDCFQLYGSCCLEFGGDDLWKEREEENEDSESPEH